MADLLEGLNPSQRQAVQINEGSLLVFAGAGSGKTRVITTKIAYAIENNLVKPYQILAVTFTNKACREMQDRVCTMIDPQLASQPVIKTFHSLGVKLLRKYGEKLGINPNFTIYDERESLALLCQCFPQADKDELKQHSQNIALLKEKGLPLTGTYAQAYEKALRDTGNIDFGDMIVKPIELLKNFEDVRNEVHNRFRYILVDEYQDTNPSQLELLQLLKGPDSFICAVGDDDQSIYRFRSSDVKTILSFPKHFPNTQTVVLSVNYRCSANILAAAKDVIDNNKSRQQKNLKAAYDYGTKPVLIKVNSEMDEADEIAKLLIANPCNEHLSTAILYRTNAQSMTFEKKLSFYRIPYQVVGDLSFYSREEIADATALLKIVVNRSDAVSFARVSAKLADGFGQGSITKVLNYAAEKGMDILDTCLSNDVVKGKAAEGLGQFAKVWHEKTVQLGTVENSVFVHNLIKDFGLLDYYKKREEKEAAKYDSRTEDLNQFTIQFEQENYAEGLEGIYIYLEDRALDSSMADENENKANAVTLITMHRTKGLEFDRVFVTGLEDNVFFRSSNIEKEDEEEERRLVYVAMTRARKELYLTTCSTRFMYGGTMYNKPVMFLNEISREHLDVKDRRTYETPFSKGWGTYQSNNRYASKTYIKPSRDLLEEYEPPKPKVTLIKKQSNSNAVKKSFNIGDQVRNEIMGKGKVVAKKKFGERDTIIVVFDDGRQATYLEATAPLEII